MDSRTKQPISGALITVGNTVAQSDAKGTFQIPTSDATVGVRAVGYLRTQIPASACASGEPVVQLTPFRPKALYLSFFSIGTPSLRHKALRHIHETELNALVIDTKSDRGLVAYHSAIPLAKEDGAQHIILVPCRTRKAFDPQANSSTCFRWLCANNPRGGGESPGKNPADR